LVFIFAILVLSNHDNWGNFSKSKTPKPHALHVALSGLVFLGTSVFSSLAQESIKPIPGISERIRLVSDVKSKIFDQWDIDPALAVLAPGYTPLNQVILSAAEITHCTLVSNTAHQFSTKILVEAKIMGMRIETLEFFSVVSPKNRSCSY